MRDDEERSACTGTTWDDPARMAERLAALAREARLLELALDGTGDGAHQLAADLETALENAMDADSADDLTQAALAIEAVLDDIIGRGMRLSAEMTDMEVEGVLGRSRMAVLTAVLSSAPRA
jgi:hypothetical protein